MRSATRAARWTAAPFRGHDGEGSPLEALGYTSVLEALAEKFHSSPRLLQRLNPGASFSRAGEVLRVPNVHTEPPAAKAAKVVVDDSDGSVSALGGKGEVIASYPATMGSQYDPLPVGAWQIKGVSRNAPFSTIRTSSGTPMRRMRRRSSRQDQTTL